MAEAAPVFTFPMTPRASRTPLSAHAFYKGTPEVWLVAVDCSAVLPPGLTIAEVTAQASDRTDPEGTAEVLDPEGTDVAGSQARLVVQAGTPGHTYALSVQVTLDDALPTVLDETLMMAIL